MHENQSNDLKHPGLKDPGEMNLVEIWLRWDPTRLIAGAMGGLLAGAVMIAFASVLSVIANKEIFYFLKLGALPFLGASATEFGLHWNAIWVGTAFYEIFAMILGVIFAHFTGTNSLLPLLGMGLVWGLFTWIFVFNLFIQSFPEVLAAHFSSGAAFPVALVFGLSMVSVAFFDRVLRGDRK